MTVCPGRPRATSRLRLFGRALLRRCPNCGQRGIFRRWLTMASECPGCGLHFERREPGYIVGAYMMNIAAAELIWLLVMVALVVATWPSPPWGLLTWGGAALMVIAPIVFYPVAKTIFLAMDLAVRPPGAE